VYYDFATDRAVLTQAVVHTVDPKSNVPVIIRAQMIRQLSEGEFVADKAILTSSSFATPSYAIGMSKIYMRNVDTGDPRLGTYTEFTGSDAKFRMFDVPIFYLPTMGGVITERGAVFRNFETGSDTRFGPSVRTQWGLFETLGKIPPLNTDITYEADYFGKRGPGGGITGKYEGGLSTEFTKEPWSFAGDFNAFFVDDHGKDDLGRRRLDVTPPTETRGRIDLHHQYFLPDDWQLQLSVGYASDPTFLEEWYRTEFFARDPEQTALYLKRQRDTEALTLLVSGQFNNFVTTFQDAQEQAEVQKLPELGYRRIGDSLGGDTLTFFSDNTFSGLQFRRSNASLAEQGYAPGQSPGLPSYGTTGIPGNEVFRGDFRQELDYPFSAGQFRMVPYVIGRYTVYSDSPSGSEKDRVYAGTGVRMTTAFWKVDDTVESSFWDLHRLRHVVEPEVNLFTSAENVNRDKLFQYDEQIDEINDITGAQVALRQQWQTKRGGAGRWRSVDFLSVNVEGNFYTHKPNDVLMDPTKFRGLFFQSMPEASIPRNSINADATWRVTDTTAVLSDAAYNLDKSTLATASIGLAAQRGDRLTYFLGQRYIEALNSNITSFAASYAMTQKYTLGFRQSFDFGQNHNVVSEVTVVRHFDRFFAALTLRYDAIGSGTGFMFNFYPEGLGRNAGTGTEGLSRVFGGGP
jgi:lipopolysaccharide assembly outer membrane protein LptD (OstA)